MKIFSSIFFLSIFLTNALTATAEEAKLVMPLRVGVILPLTGEAASIGDSVKNGMQLAYQKLSSEEKRQIELIFEDDALISKYTISAFNKLSSTGRGIDVVVSISSGPAKALAPITEKKQIPHIAIASDPEVVRDRLWTVIFWVTIESEVSIMVPEIIRRGYHSIARISTTQNGALAFKTPFDKAAEGKINIVLDEDYAADIKDFKPFITKIRAKQDKIDGVLVALLPGQLGLFAKQARQLGVTVPLFGWEIFEDANEVKTSEGALIGQWYVNGDDPDQKFINEYTQKYPNASLFGASNAHDIVLLISQALKYGNTRSKINEFLHTAKNLKGALGTYSASGDNRFTLPATIKVVTKDGFSKLR